MSQMSECQAVSKKSFYNLKYYARKTGYGFNRHDKFVTTPMNRRSSQIENSLKGYGFVIRLNLFYDGNTVL